MEGRALDDAKPEGEKDAHTQGPKDMVCATGSSLKQITLLH